MKKDLNNDGKVTMTEQILAGLASYGHFEGIKSKRQVIWLYK